MSQTLSIRLLGGMSLCHDDLTLTEQLSRRQQELLAYLVLHQDVPQSRQRLAFQFWPDSPDDRARANLRKELSRFRKSLPDADEFLRVTPKTLQWNSESCFTLDVADFEAIFKGTTPITTEELKSALGLYRGEFLPDLDSEWVQPERDRLHQLYVRILETLIQQLETQGDYATAITYAQQLLRVDDVHEGAYAALMRLYSLAGDRANALQTYHRCMTILREELGVDPSVTTRQLYDQLLQADEVTPVRQTVFPLPPPSISPALPTLIGREREWQTLHQWSQPLFSNQGSSEVILLVGEPGIGKTRLLEELSAAAETAQIQVLQGSGYTAEMMRPYGFWIDMLRSGDLGASTNLPVALRALLPELGPQPQTLSDSSHLYDAVVDILTQWTHQAPLLLLLDDIQGLDEASAALLSYVIRVMGYAPVGFACSARPQELEANRAANQVVKVLRRDCNLQVLSLAALEPEATVALARSVDAHLDAGQVYTNSGGNPLFVLEIARAISDGNRAYSDTLEALIQDRLHQLDDSIHDLLNWAAVMGGSFNPMLVAHIAEAPLTRFLKAMTTLEQQGILSPDTMANGIVGYVFAHDIIRQVAYDQLSDPCRRLMHRHIARQLQEMDSTDDELASDIAYHAIQGQDAVLAATACVTAAERGLRLFAYADAATLVQHGLEQCQQLTPPVQIALQLRLLKVSVLAGIPPEQASVMEAKLNHLVETAHQLDLQEAEALGREALLILHYEQGNLTEVYEHCLQAAEQGEYASPAVNAKMLAHTGWCLADIGREMERAEALLLQAQSLTERLNLNSFEVPCGLGCVARYWGQHDIARPLLKRAALIAQNLQDHWRTFLCLSYLVMLELEAGNAAVAFATSQDLIEVAAQFGEGSEKSTALAYQSLSQYWLEPSVAPGALSSSLEELQRLDARRTLAYVLTSAAETDLQQHRLQAAMSKSQAALKTAQAIDQPNDSALARALLIKSYLTCGEVEAAHMECHALQQMPLAGSSLRTQRAIEAISAQLSQAPYQNRSDLNRDLADSTSIVSP